VNRHANYNVWSMYAKSKVRKSRSASVNGVKTHFHIAPCLPTDQSQPKPGPVNRQVRKSNSARFNGVKTHFHIAPCLPTTKAYQSHAPWIDILIIVFEACMLSHKCGRAAVQVLTVSRHTFILHLVNLQTKANQSQPKSCPVNRQVRKSCSASVNGVKTHFHIAPCLPTDQSQPKPTKAMPREQTCLL